MANNQLTGRVYFGGQARGHVNVRIYEASTDRLAQVGSTETAGDGTFSCSPSSTTTDGVFYALVYPAGNEILLATIIGPIIQGSIIINELTTVAAAFSMAQFIDNNTIQGDDFGLRIAWGMNDNLVNVRTGEPSEVLMNSPNGDETNSLRSMRALANLLMACAHQPRAATDKLLALTTPPHGTAPLNTFQALANITLNPANNVADLYTQSKAVELYTPALERQPDAWTLAVKVNVAGFDQSGTPIPFGGPANLVFDQNGYAWVANNVFQGTPNSGNYIVVLKPNGMPADGLDGMPKSPVTGGGILGPGFGIDIDRKGNIWVGNFGWGNEPGDKPSPDGSGSVSKFHANGQPKSGDEGYQGGTDRVQGIAVDQDNNIWFASFENNSVVVFPCGDATNPLPPFSESDKSRPFGIAIAHDGSAWVTNSGGLWEGSPSSLSKYAIEDGQLVPQFPTFEVGHALKGVAVDSLGNAWVASGGDNAIYLFSHKGEQLGKFSGGGINAPWGATLDGDDNVWVANFGPMTPGNVFNTSAVSKLAGHNPETRPHGLKTGDPISPPSGYTLPTGGSEVLLPDGQSLYGAGGAKCFNPLMRLTNVVIDRAGNVWAMNNWKPDIDVDFGGNPGGDGIVIFVGLARPPQKKH